MKLFKQTIIVEDFISSDLHLQHSYFIIDIIASVKERIHLRMSLHSLYYP